MEFAKSKIKYIYIGAKDHFDYQSYLRSITDSDEEVQKALDKEIVFLYIEDEFFLRGRTPGEIRLIDGVEERWDYVAILEAKERYESIWEKEFGFNKNDSDEGGEIKIGEVEG